MSVDVARERNLKRKRKKRSQVSLLFYCASIVLLFFPIWESVFGSNCTVSSVRFEEVKQSFWGFSEFKFILLRYPLDAIQLFPYDKSVKTCLAVTELVCLFICLYPQYLEGKGVNNTQKTSHSEVHPHPDTSIAQVGIQQQTNTKHTWNSLVFRCVSKF